MTKEKRVYRRLIIEKIYDGPFSFPFPFTASFFLFLFLPSILYDVDIS
jgi:hypothetical protein